LRPGCIDSAYDGEPATIYREELRRARKQYSCGECGDPIKVGALHEVSTGLWDGKWYTHRTCARCVNVRTDYFYRWIYGCMVEDFIEAHGFDYRDGIPADFGPCKETTK
jgi:hypothetical protein